MEQLLNEIPVSDTTRTLIGLALIIFVTALAAAVVRVAVFSVISRFTSRTRTTFDDRLLKSTRGVLTLLVYVFGLSVLFDFVELRHTEQIGEHLFRVLDGFIYAFGVMVVAVLLLRVVSTVLAWYSATIASRTETTLDDELMPLLDRTIKIVVYILAVLVILDNFKIDIKGLVAVLGVGSLAVALAAQETLANMIGGFTIMIDRPFRIGDLVHLPDGRRVAVHEIGIRSTKFRTFDNTLVIVPNAELVKSTVHNITYPAPNVRVVVDVGVDYGTDIDKVRRVMLDEAARHKLVMDDPEPQFLFQNFGDSSLDVSLRCHTARPEDHRQVSSDLRHQILNRFRAEGIQIPFPQRVVTMVPGNNGGDSENGL